LRLGCAPGSAPRDPGPPPLAALAALVGGGGRARVVRSTRAEATPDSAPQMAACCAPFSSPGTTGQGRDGRMRCSEGVLLVGLSCQVTLSCPTSMHDPPLSDHLLCGHRPCLTLPRSPPCAPPFLLSTPPPDSQPPCSAVQHAPRASPCSSSWPSAAAAMRRAAPKRARVPALMPLRLSHSRPRSSSGSAERVESFPL
jgi:hypothetical protein